MTEQNLSEKEKICSCLKRKKSKHIARYSAGLKQQGFNKLEVASSKQYAF